MEPIKFKDQTAIIAKNQPQYFPYPALVIDIIDDPNGPVISCWKFTWKERIKIFFGKKLWLSLACFGKPVTPVKLSIDRTDIYTNEDDRRFSTK